jgi:hypothetical protein
MREGHFDPTVRGDRQLQRHPDWLLFHSRGKRSFTLDFEWNKSSDPGAPLPSWAVAIMAFHQSWPVVDARKAKYLVLYAKQSDPDEKLDLKLGITTSGVTDRAPKTETGLVGISQFAEGRKIGKDWTRVVIPLSVFPEVNKIERKLVQRLRVELDGDPPKDKKSFIMLDDIYFTDVTLVTPVENPGYLARADGILLVWDKAYGEEIDKFEISVGGRVVKTVSGKDRMALVPSGVFPAGKNVEVSIVTVVGDEKSKPAMIKVPAERPLEGDAVVNAQPGPSHKVSPYLFGATFASAKAIKDAGVTVNRWGGIRASKYDWDRDVDSAGSTNCFKNGRAKRRGTAEDQKGYYGFIKSTLDAHGEVNFQIPIGPWIAKAHPDERDAYCSFPLNLYPKQRKKCDFECGDGVQPNGTPIWGNDPNISMIPNTPAHQKGLIENVKKLFGGAAKGGVKFFTLDHEPGLWMQTHRDTVPKGITAEELVKRNIDYATMIKSVDPAAQVVGMVAWGPIELGGSNVDYMPPGPNGYKSYGNFTSDEQMWREVKQHGGKSQLEYYLEQMKLAEQKSGKRLIDVVDVHETPDLSGIDSTGKPQGLMENLPYDPALAEQQFDALRVWYDPSYDNPGSPLMNPAWKDHVWTPFHPILPKLKQLIDKYYPGTKLGLSEYNSGSHEYYHGAIIRAALLGIFMQEDVYLAHNANQDNRGEKFTFLVQKLYNNYDGQGSAVRGDFYKSSSSEKRLMSFVTKNVTNKGPRWYVVLVNTDVRKRFKVTITLPEKVQKLRSYVIAETLGYRLQPLSEQKAFGNLLAVYASPYSATLVVAQP